MILRYIVFGHEPKQPLDVRFEGPERRRGGAEPVTQQVRPSTSISGQSETAKHADGRQTCAGERRGRGDQREEEKR